MLEELDLAALGAVYCSHFHALTVEAYSGCNGQKGGTCPVNGVTVENGSRPPGLTAQSIVDEHLEEGLVTDPLTCGDLPRLLQVGLREP